ncbi:MAG: polyphosphate polymerase domain-containing protein [Ardenticatenaceae bacterium]|nr:polyphosphate polymerase domain-containing protein [Ardenticatenaceae bacterium]
MMNDLSHTIRKFNRFELKYLLTLQQAEQFKTGLRRYLVPDEHGNNNGRYALTSLYYDSPGLRCYWEKENGIKFRRKLRLRRYETGEILTEETPIFLEIKQRIDRVTQKRRAVLPYGEALRLCNDRQLPDYAPEDKAVIEEIFVFLWQYNLRPMSIIRYDRQAFMGTEYDIGLRVTFDTGLSFQTHPLHLHERPSSLPMLAPNLTVMEIKVNERIPSWLTDMIAAHNLQLIRVSKYCRSIEAAQNMPIVPWQQPLAESAQDVLSSSFSIFSKLRQKIGVEKQK